MKKSVVALLLRLLFIPFIIHPGNIVLAQTLKNLTIGGKYTGPKSVETAIRGYNGTLTIGSLNDGTVHSFHFISRNVINNRTEIPLFISDADKFLENMNSDLNISFDRKYWTHHEFSQGNWYDVATFTKDSASYLVSFTVNLGENLSTILLTITNEEISAKGAYENLMNDSR